MEGIDVAGRMLRAPRIEVKCAPEGVTISCDDERDPTQWVRVFITAAALWQLVNQSDDGGQFFIPAVPPSPLDEIDLGELPDPAPRVPVPPFWGLPPVPPPPPKG